MPVQDDLGVALVQALLFHLGKLLDQVLVRVFKVISLLDKLFYIMVNVFSGSYLVCDLGHERLYFFNGPDVFLLDVKVRPSGLFVT